MRALKTISLVVLVASATTILGAQQTKASTQPARPQAPVTAAEVEKASTAPTDSYTYDAAGRRDPFMTLVGAGTGGAQRKGEGPSGMTVAEISVRGVLQSRGRLVAMILGPDNKTYIVHQGDKLADGAIRLITPQGLVVDQEVTDPLSVVKQREVRKLLRGLEDAK